MTDAVEWCNYYCTGNPAEYEAKFVLDDQEYVQKLCGECIWAFVEHGPRKADPVDE